MALLGVTRSDLRTAAVQALKASGTLAGQSVLDQRLWPLLPSAYPCILVATPSERKARAGDPRAGALTFDAMVTLVLSLRTTSAAPASGSKAKAEGDLELLADQAEEVLLCTDALTSIVQAIHAVDTDFTVTNEAKVVLGEASLSLTCELRQQFWPTGGQPLAHIEVNPPTLEAAPAAPLFTIPVPQI